MPSFTLVHADILEALRDIPDATFDSAICDPPYGLAITKSRSISNWDKASIAFAPAVWAELRRVTKPGGILVSFGHPRTNHRQVTSLEDAGWQVVDTVAWVKSSGFQAGNRSLEAELRKTGNEAVADIYRGFGTHLTPTYEPITIARNLAERESLVQAIASGGAGGLNHDATRVQENEWAWRQPRTGAVMAENRARRPGRVSDRAIWSVANRKAMSVPHPGGRLPGNVIVEHAESCTELQCEPDCIVRDIDAQGRTKYAPGKEQASRFFTRLRYTARTPASERLTIAGVSHPTQKPQALLAWLAALVVKPGDHVLDPFAGSGAIAEAVVSAGASVTSVEIEAAYVEMIRARMAGVGGQDRPPRS